MKKINAWIIAIITIGGIFYLSSIPGLRVLPVLRQLNTIVMRFDVYFIRIAEIIAQRLPVDMNELTPIQTVSNDFYAYAQANPVIIEFLLRKIAHVFVFFSLTIVLFFLLNQYTYKTYSAVLISFFTATTIAALDEFRQSFTDGRVSSLIDVGIDLIGITMATLLILFSLFITKKSKQKLPPI
ncbi:VanZ family protein [Alkaliphilus peptidifermentans]|uniref:VanZ like family protein n=1 Tax=Alkaliphilus peptidifermentans DSM 18978 TaxID=1120976 RepID=A0A1G5IUH0_9FIRM|nr:VanZ family protein [Alkaliphilus peptidifermentans]SCY79696.1 VanZ like family protein [Alkaliphilus peptidifermentans DSM 18978]